MRKKFKIKAIYKPTNRERTLIKVGNKDDLINELRVAGYCDPFEITEEIDDPSEHQMNYAIRLGINIPPKISRDELSEFISFHEMNDSYPQEGLRQFAIDNGMELSKYTGEKALLNYLYRDLPVKEKIVLFIYCVHVDYIKHPIGNPNKSNYKNLYYEFANKASNDMQFVNSMKWYSGEDLRSFGNDTSDNNYTRGSSNRTISYKTAIKYLKENTIKEVKADTNTNKIKLTILTSLPKEKFRPIKNITRKDSINKEKLPLGCTIPLAITLLYLAIRLIAAIV